MELAPIEPTEKDIDIFISIMDMVSELPADAGPGEVQNGLKGILPSNKEERRGFVEFLGTLGILKPTDTSTEAYMRIPPSSQWYEPVCLWKGSDGINLTAVKKWFGKYLFP